MFTHTSCLWPEEDYIFPGLKNATCSSHSEALRRIHNSWLVSTGALLLAPLFCRSIKGHMFITHSWFSSHRWPDRGLILSQQQSLAANVPMRSVPVPSSGVPALRCLDIAALDRHRFWEYGAEKPHLTPQKKMLLLRLPTEAQEASCCSTATCSEVAWFAAFCAKNAHGLVHPPYNASV